MAPISEMPKEELKKNKIISDGSEKIRHT